MLRVRFHGRGGQGTKTASRVFGTACFRAGLQVQDSPLYGAERRGAAIAAFARVADERICERGVIHDPDLILLADETLLDDPAAGVLNGQEFAAAVFANSVHAAADLAKHFRIASPVQTLDLSKLTQEALGHPSALSVPLGAGAAALSGLVTLEHLTCAVRDELKDLHLPITAIEKNIVLARLVFERLSSVTPRQRPTAGPAVMMNTPVYVGVPEGAPVILAPGNAPVRRTGAWRTIRPVIDRERCTRCGVCFIRCPDSAISFDAEGYPVIDYENCKGCLLCSAECPPRCIREEQEVRQW